jgi:uncharacterized membrane protein YgdD (TMEM256/DUF423 family)
LLGGRSSFFPTSFISLLSLRTHEKMVGGGVFASTSSLFFKLGCASGAGAVLLGAFGAHGLANRVDQKALQNWSTAAQYHLIHSVVLLAASSHRSKVPSYLLTGGIFLFSGSLYALVLTGEKRLGAITPIGGLSLVAGWLALALL